MAKHISDLIPLHLHEDACGDDCLKRIDKGVVVMSGELTNLNLPPIIVTEHDDWGDIGEGHQYRYTSRKRKIPEDANALLIDKRIKKNSYEAYFYRVEEKGERDIPGFETRTLSTRKIISK